MASAAADYLAECLLTEWDARDITQSDGTAIASWPKSAASTEGNDLAQGTADRRPLFRTGTYPYAQYDGTNDVLFAALVTDPEVLFLVVETTSDATLRAFCSMLSGGSYMWAYLASGTFTNGYAGTTPTANVSTVWNSAQNAARQVIAFICRSTTCGFVMHRSGNQFYATAKPTFAGQLTLGGFNAGISYPFVGKMHYAATAVGISQNKIRNTMAVIAAEWGATFDEPDAIGGGNPIAAFAHGFEVGRSGAL